MSKGLPSVQKDLSLFSLLPKWSGLEPAVPLEEFLASVDSAARIGSWDKSDCLEIAALKLLASVKSYYNTCLDLHALDTTWQKSKNVSRERFRDVNNDQHHFMRLQTASQAKNEGA